MATQFAVDLVFKSQTKQLNDVQRKLQQLEANLQKLNQGKPFKPIEDGAEQAGTKVGRLTKSLGGLRGALIGLGAGVAFRKAFGDASALESAETRIDNVTKKYQQLSGIQNVAAEAAKTFRLSQTEALTALTDLGNRLGAQGASLEDISNIYSGFNTLLANNKVEAAQAASATLQLNQALGSGRLAGEEFNAINEATPQLLDEVAKVMGVTRGELKQLAADGEISSQVLIQALTNIRNQGAAELESAFSGAYGATKEFDAALKDFSATIGTELLPAITPLLKGATELLKLFGALPGPVKTLLAAVAGLAGAFAVLAPVVSTIAGVLGSITAAGLLAAAPWLAVAAGVTALGVAMYDGTRKAQEFQRVLKDTSGTSADLMARMQDVRGRMAELSGEIERGGHKGRIAKQRYDALKASLENLQGTYKIRLEIEEVFSGGNLGAIKSSGYGRGDSGLTYTVAGVTYDARTGKPVAAPPKPFSPAPSSSSSGGKGAGGVDQTAQLQQQLALKQQLFAIEQQMQAAILAGDKVQIQALERKKIEAELDNAIALAKGNGLKVEIARLEAAEKLGKLDFEAAKKEQDRKKSLDEMLTKFDREIELAGLKTEEAKKLKQIEYDILDLRKQGLLVGDQEIEKYRQRAQAAAQAGGGNKGKLQDYMDKLKTELEDTEGMIVSLAQTVESEIGSAMSNAITGLIDGTQTAQEAFSNMFKNIGKAFIDMATQMIAKYVMLIAMQALFKALGGPSLGGGGGSMDLSGTQTFNVPIDQMPAGMQFAEGGYVTGPTNALIGEAGESEYVIPSSKMGTAMANYRAGKRGDSVIEDSSGTGASSEGGSNTFTLETVVINNVEYATVAQVREMGAVAAKQGAAGGYAKTMGTLKNSISQRKKVGI